MVTVSVASSMVTESVACSSSSWEDAMESSGQSAGSRGEVTEILMGLSATATAV
jgi:hypothetical protein